MSEVWVPKQWQRLWFVCRHLFSVINEWDADPLDLISRVIAVEKILLIDWALSLPSRLPPVFCIMAALPPSPSSLQDVEGYIMLAKPKHFEPRPKYAVSKYYTSIYQLVLIQFTKVKDWSSSCGGFNSSWWSWQSESRSSFAQSSGQSTAAAHLRLQSSGR